MISKGAFRHVESELYAYPETQREIERLRLETLHPYDSDPDDPTIVKGANSVRKPGDPTGQTATALVTHRKLEELKRIARAIETTVNGLPSDRQHVLELWYWTRPRTLSWDGVALRVGVSRITAIRWRNDIVKAIAIKLGWR